MQGDLKTCIIILVIVYAVDNRNCSILLLSISWFDHNDVSDLSNTLLYPKKNVAYIFWLV